jgi:uncharacterized protein (DUF2147 family)
MKKSIYFLLVLMLSVSTYAQKSSAEADKILGTWLTGNGKAHILITKYGDKYGGKIVWMREPNDENGKPKLDFKNPDESKRKNPKMGLSLLLGFTYDGDGEYENGTIYDPENGKTYKCVINIEGNDVLKVRGYVGFSLIGRTDTWTRVKS